MEQRQAFVEKYVFLIAVLGAVDSGVKSEKLNEGCNVEKTSMGNHIEQDRICSFDLLKFIMAFLVCIIHWSDSSQDFYLIPARIAVPVFITISGYFWPSEKEKQIRQIKKLLFLLIEAQVFYFVFYFVLIKVFNGHLLQTWMSEVFNIRAVIDCLLFNRASLGGHTWYLFAVLYTMIIIMLLQKMKWEKLLLVLSVIGLIFLLAAGKYSLLIFKVDVPTYYTKNYFCVGIPFFSLGIFLKREQTQAWITKLPNHLILICIAMFCASGFAEKAILHHFSIEGTREFYISTVLLVAVLMVFAVKNQSFGYSLPLLRKIGEKYSGMIYIIHIAVITIVLKIAGIFPVTNYLYRILGFVLIFILSLAFAVLWEKGKHYYAVAR